jgi:hypothetical protein
MPISGRPRAGPYASAANASSRRFWKGFIVCPFFVLPNKKLRPSFRAQRHERLVCRNVVEGVLRGKAVAVCVAYFLEDDSALVVENEG